MEDKRPVYRITLAGSAHDIVGVGVEQLLRWINERRLKFCARGLKVGELRLEQVQEQDFATRNVVVGKDDHVN